MDPSGHFGVGGTIGWVDKHAPDKWKSGIHDFATDGLDFLNWWDSKPSGCDRNQNLGFGAPTDAALFVNKWGANQGSQLALSGATTPVKRVVEQVTYYSRSLSGEIYIYRELGSRANVDVTKWGPFGSQGGGYTVNRLQDGYHVRTTGAAMKVKNSHIKLVEGAKGLEGAVVGAGFIDAFFQLFGDIISGLCLSPEQMAWRALAAFGFGIVAVAVGAVVGGIAVSAGATSFYFPAIASFAASSGATGVMKSTKNRITDMVTNATNH